MTPNTNPTRDDLGALVAGVLVLIVLMGCAALAMQPRPIDRAITHAEASK